MKNANNPARRWLLPAVPLALLWWLIAKGDPSSWLIGLCCIAVALVSFDRLRERSGPSLRVWRLPGFAVWFLWHSLRGGVDVARRVLQPRMPLRPGFVHYRLTLPQGETRVFLLNCVSLMPGSLSAGIEGDVLVLHALDTGSDVFAEVSSVEHRVHHLYGIAADSRHG